MKFSLLVLLRLYGHRTCLCLIDTLRFILQEPKLQLQPFNQRERCIYLGDLALRREEDLGEGI